MTEKHLLVVDDEKNFGKFVAEVAVSVGYEVELTTGGTEFIRTYEERKPTAIVLDVIMPDMDGFEIATWLAEQRFDGHVIVVTGYAPMYAKLLETLSLAKGLRSVTKILKPVRAKTLRDALDFDGPTQSLD
jgi:CheY-like chemotaxis protein